MIGGFLSPMVFLLLNELCPLRGRMRYQSHYESRISLTYNHESIHDSLKIALESLIESYTIPKLFIQGSQFILDSNVVHIIVIKLYQHSKITHSDQSFALTKQDKNHHGDQGPKPRCFSV